MVNVEEIKNRNNPDYPDEEDLERLEKWKCELDEIGEWLRFAANIYKYSVTIYDGHLYVFVTGGWSGNESIMAAMKRNWMMHAISWQSSCSGGLHIYSSDQTKALDLDSAPHFLRMWRDKEADNG